MSYALARIKKGVGGLNVYSGPGGDKNLWRDAIEPHGVYIQTVGMPMVRLRGVDWVEVMYQRPSSKPERGWVAEHCLDIDWQTFKGTVHEAQVEYEKSVSFPKPPDTPRIDLREFVPPRYGPGFWLTVGFGALLAVIFLAKLYFHMN
jgi:hypothetical protein